MGNWIKALLVLAVFGAHSVAHAVPSKLIITNQFGEQSSNIVSGSGLPLPGTYNLILFSGATAPIDGTTGDNVAAKGSIYIARDTGVIYANTGTISSPAWSILASDPVDVLGTALTGYSSGAGTVSAVDTILEGINKLNGNQVLSKATADAALPSASFTSAAVTGKLLTGYSSSAGTVAAGDTILVGINKLNGNQVLSKATADAALPSASFTDAAVTGKVLTGLAAGADSTILSTDTVLEALAKLQAQIDAL